MQALGEDDKANIHQTIDDEVLQRKDIAFRSTRVEQGDDGLHVEGGLTIGDATGRLAFAVMLDDDGALDATAVIKQSDWQIKPYSALFGALKVRDEVEVRAQSR